MACAQPAEVAPTECRGEQTIARGNRIIDFRAETTVKAIAKELSKVEIAVLRRSDGALRRRQRPISGYAQWDALRGVRAVRMVIPPLGNVLTFFFDEGELL